MPNCTQTRPVRRVGLQRSRRGIISMASEAQKAAWRRYEQKKRLPRKDNRDRGKRDRTRDQQARRTHKKAAAILAAIAQEGPLISMARSEAQKAAERNYEKKRGPRKRKRIDKRHYQTISLITYLIIRV